MGLRGGYKTGGLHPQVANACQAGLLPDICTVRPPIAAARTVLNFPACRIDTVAVLGLIHLEDGMDVAGA